jgi:hypothetical protein
MITMPVRTAKRNFRCPEDVWEAASAKAYENRETITEVLVRALREYGSVVPMVDKNDLSTTPTPVGDPLPVDHVFKPRPGNALRCFTCGRRKAEH